VLTRSELKKQYADKFLTDSKIAHGDRYDYSRVNYVNNYTKVEILCKDHGHFWAKPTHHKAGINCPKCGDLASHKNSTHTWDQVLEKFRKVHGNRYIYSADGYVNAKSKIKITCRIHGEFEQVVSNHCVRKGCKKCSDITTGRKVGRIQRAKVADGTFKKGEASGWSYSEWGKFGKKSKTFDSFKFYLVRCKGGGELFLKYGKTFRTIKQRMSELPYETDLVSMVIGDAVYISELEDQFAQANKEIKYKPKNSFGGQGECVAWTGVAKNQERIKKHSAHSQKGDVPGQVTFEEKQ